MSSVPILCAIAIGVSLSPDSTRDRQSLLDSRPRQTLSHTLSLRLSRVAPPPDSRATATTRLTDSRRGQSPALQAVGCWTPSRTETLEGLTGAPPASLKTK